MFNSIGENGMPDIPAIMAKRAFRKARVAFLEDISEVLTSGSGGLQGKLLALADRNIGKPLERVYRHVYAVINQGGDISTAVRPFFPRKEFSMIAAYDAGASNDQERGKGLLAVSKILGPIQELKRAGIKLMFSVAFSIIVILIMWLGVAGSFAKEMAQLAPRNTWSIFSLVVIGSGEWLTAHALTTSLALCILFGTLIWAFPNWRGNRRAWADQHIPGFMVYKDFRSALTLIALASFIKSRQGLGAAFKQVGESATSWEIWYLEQMRENSTRLSGSAMLDVGFFDTRIIDRLVMRDEVMPLEQSLEQVGLEQAHKVVDSMRLRLESAGKAAGSISFSFAGAVAIAVLLINLSAMSNLSITR